jgi:hypothetical protein
LLRGIWEREVSLADLLLPPADRHKSGGEVSVSTSSASLNQSVTHDDDCFSTAEAPAPVPSILPPVFELHVPPAVLKFLFYAIGEEYPNGHEQGGEFLVAEHSHTTAAAATAAVTPASSALLGKGVSGDDSEEAKRVIKQVCSDKRI